MNYITLKKAIVMAELLCLDTKKVTVSDIATLLKMYDALLFNGEQISKAEYALLVAKAHL